MENKDWKPIATAPKNTTKQILVKGLDWLLPDNQSFGIYADREYIAVCQYLKDPDDEGFDWYTDFGQTVRPTHWREL